MLEHKTLVRNGITGELATSAQPPVEMLYLAEITPDLVATFDVAGKIHYLNPAGRRMLGIGSEEGTDDLDIASVHPVWASVLILGEGIETALLDGSWRGETALLSREGREIPVSQVILAHPAPDHECAFLSTIARDITEIKRAEAALRHNERFYREIVETANVGMWVIDPEDRTAFVNSRMARLLGYRVEEMIGQPLATFLNASPANAEERSERAATEPRLEASQPAKTRRTFRLRRKNGSEFWASLSTSPLYDSEERYTGVLGVVTGTIEHHMAAVSAHTN